MSALYGQCSKCGGTLSVNHVCHAWLNKNVVNMDEREKHELSMIVLAASRSTWMKHIRLVKP